MSPFEIGMLLCFGAAWPLSIAKSWKARSTKGKSLFFLIVILVGYACGILNKLLVRYDGVLWLYVLNGLMVATDVALWFRNRRLEGQA
ncbi:MAG TPA: hypothetical protein P5165_05980 [Spirochaetia bacterium]|nr:hypothetical protein [Spirochaetales bacterium]HRY72756.1 hypothetical protein [Spirochaetia bacterium]